MTNRAKNLISKASQSKAIGFLGSIFVITIVGQVISNVATNRFEEVRQRQKTKGQNPSNATVFFWLFVVIVCLGFYFQYYLKNEK